MKPSANKGTNKKAHWNVANLQATSVTMILVKDICSAFVEKLHLKVYSLYMQPTRQGYRHSKTLNTLH